MKKIFVVFGMIFFIYSTMSIFSGELNPLLWISGSSNRVGALSLAFSIELFLFVAACISILDIDL